MCVSISGINSDAFPLIRQVNPVRLDSLASAIGPRHSKCLSCLLQIGIPVPIVGYPQVHLTMNTV
jgi:hypothetical protein